jgi:hypothetical protein
MVRQMGGETSAVSMPDESAQPRSAETVEIRTQADGQAWRLTHDGDRSATAAFS